MHRQPRVRVPRRRRLHKGMNKRVHEIAKERGLPARDVLARLKAAGIEVKASSSSVDEEVAARVLANGDATAPADGAKSKPPGSKAKGDDAKGSRKAPASTTHEEASPASVAAANIDAAPQSSRGSIRRGESRSCRHRRPARCAPTRIC